MSTIPSRLAEAIHLLAACGWSVTEQQEGTRLIYLVHDKKGRARRAFVPIDRLFDYAKGVFDAQEWDQ
jgi:hypothetical protein